MKYILLMILLSSILFSYEKYIIVGSYKNSVNSVNAVKRLKWLSINDAKLKNLIEKNSLKIVSKKIGKYEVVTLQAFNSDVELLRTLKVLNKYYDAPYVHSYKQKVEKVERVSKIDLSTVLKNKIETKPVIVDYIWDKTAKKWVELVPEKKK